jgi:hypothetical protein
MCCVRIKSAKALLDRALRLDVDAAARRDPCLDDDLLACGQAAAAAPGTPSSFVAAARSPSPLLLPATNLPIDGDDGGYGEEEAEEEEDSITPPRTPGSGAESSEGLHVQTAFDPFSARGGVIVGRIATTGASDIGSDIGSEEVSASAGGGGYHDSVEEDLDFPDSGTSSAVASAAVRPRPGVADNVGGVGIASESIRTDGGGGYSDTFEHLDGGVGGSSSVPEDVATSSLEARVQVDIHWQ